jgi:hypothetical protein
MLGGDKPTVAGYRCDTQKLTIYDHDKIFTTIFVMLFVIMCLVHISYTGAICFATYSGITEPIATWIFWYIYIICLPVLL